MTTPPGGQYGGIGQGSQWPNQYYLRWQNYPMHQNGFYFHPYQGGWTVPNYSFAQGHPPPQVSSQPPRMFETNRSEAPEDITKKLIPQLLSRNEAIVGGFTARQRIFLGGLEVFLKHMWIYDTSPPCGFMEADRFRAEMLKKFSGLMQELKHSQETTFRDISGFANDISYLSSDGLSYSPGPYREIVVARGDQHIDHIGQSFNIPLKFIIDCQSEISSGLQTNAFVEVITAVDRLNTIEAAEVERSKLSILEQFRHCTARIENSMLVEYTYLAALRRLCDFAHGFSMIDLTETRLVARANVKLPSFSVRNFWFRDRKSPWAHFTGSDPSIGKPIHQLSQKQDLHEPAVDIVTQSEDNKGHGFRDLRDVNAPLEVRHLNSGPLDGGPLDGGSLDDGSLDDGSLDDGSLDDGSLDDGSLDDGPLDDGSLDGSPLYGRPIESQSEQSPGRIDGSNPQPLGLERKDNVADIDCYATINPEEIKNDVLRFRKLWEDDLKKRTLNEVLASLFKEASCRFCSISQGSNIICHSQKSLTACIVCTQKTLRCDIVATEADGISLYVAMLPIASMPKLTLRNLWSFVSNKNHLIEEQLARRIWTKYSKCLPCLFSLNKKTQGCKHQAYKRNVQSEDRRKYKRACEQCQKTKDETPPGAPAPPGCFIISSSRVDSMSSSTDRTWLFARFLWKRESQSNPDLVPRQILLPLYTVGKKTDKQIKEQQYLLVDGYQLPGAIINPGESADAHPPRPVESERQSHSKERLGDSEAHNRLDHHQAEQAAKAQRLRKEHRPDREDRSVSPPAEEAGARRAPQTTTDLTVQGRPNIPNKVKAAPHNYRHKRT